MSVNIGIERFLLYLWMSGVLCGALKLVCGVISASLLVKRATPITIPLWQNLLDECSTATGLSRRVPVLECDRAAVASTVGILHPRILVSSDARSWPPERIRMVLLHELAHVRRRDCVVQALTI
jgi:beta-lactamase regulating signal transducer with metallopeptidase domain